MGYAVHIAHLATESTCRDIPRAVRRKCNSVDSRRQTVDVDDVWDREEKAWGKRKCVEMILLSHN